jgi:hypothetical protein
MDFGERDVDEVALEGLTLSPKADISPHVILLFSWNLSMDFKLFLPTEKIRDDVQIFLRGSIHTPGVFS